MNILKNRVADLVFPLFTIIVKLLMGFLSGIFFVFNNILVSYIIVPFISQIIREAKNVYEILKHRFCRVLMFDQLLFFCSNKFTSDNFNVIWIVNWFNRQFICGWGNGFEFKHIYWTKCCRCNSICFVPTYHMLFLFYSLQNYKFLYSFLM